MVPIYSAEMTIGSPMEQILKELVIGPGPGETCPKPEHLKKAIQQVMAGEAKPTEIAALLTGLRVRGERPEHLKATVDVMLEHALAFPREDVHGPLVDTCGSGGAGRAVVNISTTAGLLAAAAGVSVAKHGNRSVSSRSGSADALEALGYKIDCAPAVSARMLKEHNFCFLFAPLYHPAMKHAGPVRREIKFRTIFNLAGPLSNPAMPTHQLIGVPQRELIEPMAKALQLLGRKGALVVHGRNGLDEISLTQMTEGLQLKADGSIASFILDPATFGVEAIEMADLVIEGPKDSAEKIRRILSGEPGPMADEVNANVAAVLWLVGQVPSIQAGFLRAREVQQSGAGLKLLENLVRDSNV